MFPGEEVGRPIDETLLHRKPSLCVFTGVAISLVARRYVSSFLASFKKQKADMAAAPSPRGALPPKQYSKALKIEI